MNKYWKLRFLNEIISWFLAKILKRGNDALLSFRGKTIFVSPMPYVLRYYLILFHGRFKITFDAWKKKKFLINLAIINYRFQSMEKINYREAMFLFSRVSINYLPLLFSLYRHFQIAPFANDGWIFFKVIKLNIIIYFIYIENIISLFTFL